jgi:putative nucleotidyltransferase with HDIG domain
MKKISPIKSFRAIPVEDRLAVLMFIALAVVLTVIIHPNLVMVPPTYRIGDVAEKNIKAPKDFLAEDAAATQNAREKAAQAVLTVYDFDEGLGVRIVSQVNRAFGEARRVLEEQQAAQKAYQEALARHEQVLAARADAQGLTPVAAPAPPAYATPRQALMAHRSVFEANLGIEVPEGAYSFLVSENFDPAIAALIGQIVKTVMDNGVVADKEALIQELPRGVTLRNIKSQTEQVVTGLRRFYSIDQAKTMVRVVGDPLLRDLNYNRLNLVVDFSQRLLSQPNIFLNPQETSARRQMASENAKPVFFQVKSGEMLLREGERITQEHLLKLSALVSEAVPERILARSLGIGALLLIFFFTFYFIYFRPGRRTRDQKIKDVALICIVLAGFFLLARGFMELIASVPHEAAYPPFPSPLILAAPLAAAPMILCLFLGLGAALPFVIVLTFCLSVLFGQPFETWVYFLVSGSLAAYWVRACRERNVFVKAGVFIGLLQAVLITVLYLAKGAPLLGTPHLYDLAAGMVGGLFAGVLTAGIAPLIEIAMGYTTDIKLMELANLDRPVLRRLMIEAPGTYHHSVIVGSLVEAAAAEINANPLLAKVCGYYHDIGKIKKPLYFIENQVPGKNRHDKLAPSMSALILIAHVRDGVEMANRHKLGVPIVDAIQQHHGTSIIAFFYEKAKQLRGEDAVRVDDFRYPGPKPQTKEAGLVMLADVVEAASRTLEDPTPARIQGLVQRLINKVFSDGQLDECELTLKDLHQIAKSFNKILAGIYHHRVEYEPAGTRANGKGKKASGSSDRQPAKPAQNSEKKDDSQREDPLKRLGL